MYFEDIIEYFRSFQGESPFVGYSALFIRFRLCNLMKVCIFCDTLEKMKSNNTMKVPFKSVLDQLKKYSIQTLTFTGGEPTLEPYRKQIVSFLEYAIENDSSLIKTVKIMVESNGFNLYELLEEVYSIDEAFKTNFYVVWSPKFFVIGDKDPVELNCLIFDKVSHIINPNNLFIKPVVTKDNIVYVDRFLSYLTPYWKTKVFIMPEGKTQEELNQSSAFATKFALERNVNVSPRMHISYNLP